MPDDDQHERIMAFFLCTSLYLSLYAPQLGWSINPEIFIIYEHNQINLQAMSIWSIAL